MSCAPTCHQLALMVDTGKYIACPYSLILEACVLSFIDVILDLQHLSTFIFMRKPTFFSRSRVLFEKAYIK